MWLPLCFCFSAFLLLCFSLLPPPALSANLTTDAEALLAFKAITGTESLPSWDASSISSICSWVGITCSNESSTQRVTTLSLPGYSLSGQIPPDVLGKLDALQNLSLGSNQFSGEFPADLANCASLRGLFLQNNKFAGPLPTSAFNAWPSLMQVDLSFNNFNGSIPQSITNASLLQLLDLQNNSFSGAIPPIPTSQLQSFSVANNALSGSIPSSLSRFSATSFAGNDGLCGDPLQDTCPPSPAGTTLSSTPSKEARTLSTGALVGIIMGSVIVVASLIFLLLVSIKAKSKSHRRPSARVNDVDRLRKLEENAQEGALRTREAPEEKEPIAKGEDKMVYVDKSYKEAFDIDGLLSASAELLGQGSLGTAFMAMLENGLVVVVKRLNFEYRADYKKRLEMLGRLTHPNLVPIKAWYFFKDERLLVYDYMPSTLYNQLFHGKKPMEWHRRLQVASTVANVLAHLHAQNVVHGNIKSSNVLMDSNGEAYVTDYGLVPLSTNFTIKNSGYMSTEFVDPSKVTIKGDVYSFGVLLLELLTGRSPMPGTGKHNGTVIDLPQWVQSVVREQWTAEVFDLEIMKFEYQQEEMMLLLQIALLCVSLSPDQRPSMATLVTSIKELANSDDEGSLPPS